MTRRLGDVTPTYVKSIFTFDEKNFNKNYAQNYTLF